MLSPHLRLPLSSPLPQSDWQPDSLVPAKIAATTGLSKLGGILGAAAPGLMAVGELQRNSLPKDPEGSGPAEPSEPPAEPTASTEQPAEDPAGGKKGTGLLGKIGKVAGHPLVLAGVTGLGSALSNHAARQAEREYNDAQVQRMTNSNSLLTGNLPDWKPYPAGTAGREMEAIRKSTAPATPEPRSNPTSSFLGEAARKYVSGKAVLRDGTQTT